MKTLHVIVANKVATYLHRDGYIVCGNSDYQIEFSFDSEWDAYARKTARFIWNGKYKDVEFSGKVCPVPIIANTVRLEVGVYAEDICTTTSALITCKKSIRCNSNVISEGTVVIPNGTVSLIEKNITENGTYTPGRGYDGFSKVTVAVPNKTVEVIPEGYIKPSGTKAITENGTHDVSNYANISVEIEAEVVEIDTPLPIEVASEIEMNDLLYNGVVGGVYKYTGTAGTYENGALYVLENDLITFTIDGTSYQAEDGMTWGEWMSSEYNTDGYEPHTNLLDSVRSPNGAYCVTYNNTTTIRNIEIVDSYAYTTEYVGSGSGGAN